ncbi:tyrosine-type recombinase/integrase [Streptomyces sp. NPDC055060]
MLDPVDAPLDRTALLGLRHFAASDLYRNGMDVVAIQEILGHEWLNTTMIYVHVEKSHVEDAWIRAGQRATTRFGGTRR